MSFGSGHDLKEQIRQSVDIVDLLGRDLSLRRQGRIFVAHCPWHDDTRPSLQVNPERQSFKCWVCDIGGDVFSYVMRRDGVEFREALEALAEFAQIPLRPQKSRADGGDGLDPATLRAATAWAVEQCHRCLLESPEAQAARDYLQSRKIGPESIERFRIGYSPDSWDWLVRRAEASPFSARTMLAADLLGKSEKSGRLFDRFKGRVLFPICDSRGRAIALGGRILPGENDPRAAKYINSRETPLFSKSEQFYGLDLARDAISREKNVLVTEGYTDCVVAHQFGLANTVAVLGTAMNPRHLRLLRFADNCRITLVLDGDEAGRRRAAEILELFLTHDVDLRILTLPDGLDPCDLLQQQGAEAMRRLVAEAPDALAHKFRLATDGVSAEDTHAADRAIGDVLETLVRMPDVAAPRIQLILPRLARTFRVAEVDLRHRMSRLRKRARTAARSVGPQGHEEEGDRQEPREALERCEWELLELLLLEPEAVAKVAEDVSAAQFRSARCRRVFQACCEISQSGRTPDYQTLSLHFDEEAMQSFLVDLDEGGRRKRDSTDLPMWLDGLLTSFRRRVEAPRRDERVAVLNQSDASEKEQLEILEDLLEQQRRRQGISEPTDG